MTRAPESEPGTADLYLAGRHVQGTVGLTPEHCAQAEAPPHLKGVSAIQFITTSNVTLHCLDDLGLACVNIFTCGTIQHADIACVRDFCVEWFHARDFHEHLLNRG